jgi:regulatory protein
VRLDGRRASPAARQPDSPEAAYAEALKRLARQPQSRATLTGRLLKLGYIEDAVQAALDRAERHGYLNDREFAASLVSRRSRGRGRALIAQELRAKGIEESAAAPVLAGVDPEAEAEQALAFGRSLIARKPPTDAQALRAYLGPRLSRRGFSSGLVYQVCRRLSDEWQAAGRFDSPSERD